MDERTILYLALSVLIAVITMISAAKFGIIGIAIAIISAVAIGIMLLLAFADFIIFPLFTKALNITIIPSKDYMIPKSQDAVIKYSNGIYYATGYLTANIYNYVFAQEQVQEESAALAQAPGKWEKAMMNIHFPFRYSVIAAAEEIQRYREELEAKRGLLEFQYSRETQGSNPNTMGLETMQRQMNVIQARIDRIGEGEKPVNSMMYIESTAVGISEKEALDKLTSQLNDLSTVFNIFDLSINRVIGRELYRLHNINYRVPTLSELESEFGVQK
jgi:hypothetical protein